MTTRIRLRILMGLAVFAMLIGCSSISFGQSPCFTYSVPEGADISADEGTRIESIKHKDGKQVVRVCSNTVAPSQPRQAVTTTPVDECVRQRQQQDEAAAAAEEAAKQKADREERRRAIAEWKMSLGIGEPGHSADRQRERKEQQ